MSTTQNPATDRDSGESESVDVPAQAWRGVAADGHADTLTDETSARLAGRSRRLLADLLRPYSRVIKWLIVIVVIENAAREPEIKDVADCLAKMGAKINGAGTSQIVVEGVPRLHAARHRVLPDRIETGTYAMAVAMTGGDVMLENARAELLQAGLDVLAKVGLEYNETNRGVRVARNGHGLAPIDVATAPFPGFPTDLQAQLMALMTRAKGTSHITETIFENRFMHVQELARLGARIQLAGETATIEGVERLKGAPVMATDLRASVSLVIAALAAEGETMVNRVYHLDRGFERLEDKLSACGAAIERLSG